MRMILVSWRESWLDVDVDEPGRSATEHVVTTVGYLIRDGADLISVAAEQLPAGDGWRSVRHIYRDQIVRVVELVRSSP